MNNSIFNNNMKALKWTSAGNTELMESIHAVRNREDYNSVVIDQSVSEQSICACEKDGKLIYLNSRYDAQYAAEIWAQGITEIKYKSLYIVIGVSNGMYIRNLLKKLGSENEIIVYEPNAALFIRVMENIDLSDIFQDSRIYVCVQDINEVIFRKLFQLLCTYERANFTKILISPNYLQLFGDNVNLVVDLCGKEMRALEIGSATLYHASDEMNDNMIDNLPFIANSTSIDLLKEKMQDLKGYQDAPAIIVGAGPSLNKNIQELKKSKNKSFIIATDSAILALLKNGIIPDVLITIDPHKPLELFVDAITTELPYVVCMQTRYEVMELHRGKKIFFAAEAVTIDIYKKYNRFISTLYSGGSVACNAFSLARFLEFKNIVLIGQDLAFTGNEKHVKEIYQDTDIEDEDSPYDYVKDIDGNDILTYANFKIYKEWFESEISGMKDVRVINATEGGAYIQGAEHLSLRQVNEELCIENYDFESTVKSVPDAFSIPEKKEIDELIINLRETGKRIEKKIKETIELYRKMRWLMKTGKTNNAEFRSIKRKISKNTQEFEQNAYMELVRMYAKDQEFKTLDGVYDASDREGESLDSIMHVIDKGIRLLETYLSANNKVLTRIKRNSEKNHIK